MSGSFNWAKVERERKVSYKPSQRVRPASQRQIDYILGLAVQKGQRKPRIPKTMKGASDMIERLLALPDATNGNPVSSPGTRVTKPEIKPTPTQEVVAELRERFPQLTPMSANSLVQLFGQIDPMGMAFVLDSLMQEDTPEDTDQLILHILRRFLEEFADITHDASAMVAG